ncbi:MAG: hypothetical protein JWQ25_1622, partial [Daejeonella sp.]|nr:hypothetical protein [Daejeonella sp.]
AERINYILQDTNTKVILANTEFEAKIIQSKTKKSEIVHVDSVSMQKTLSGYPKINPQINIDSTNLAYVLYTSGTTGNPKGVMLAHQGIVNRITWMNRQYPISQTDRILQKTPYAFDVSVWELFWANWQGATLVFARPDGHKDSEYLVNTIVEKGITVIHFVPSMLSVFTEELENRSTNLSLKYIFCSGEALNLAQVKKVHQLLPQSEIHNLYGPTEASVDVLYYDCTDTNLEAVFIGRPISNTQVYILDDNQGLLPLGAIGELYLGGDGIAKGYLNLPKTTAERFLVNPFQSAKDKVTGKNARLYKTGDLAKYSREGNIEYLGRNDFQVKINGYRMELGEIEIQIASFPGVKQAIVLARENKSTQAKYLTAYYTAEQTIDEQALQAHLGVHLPEYMVPSVFVLMDTFPLSVNGKLDRKVLPEPEFAVSNAYTAPENEIEAQLCSLFADVLGLNSTTIGIDDDFFKLGGNSIRSLHLLHQINNRFGSNIRVTDIFLNRTVRSICANIKNVLEANKLVVKLNNTTDKTNMFMIHPGIAGCEVYISLANEIAGHFSCYGIDSYNFYNKQKIESLATLAKHYLSFIDEIQKNTQQKEVVLLGWSLGGLIALEIAALLESRGKKNITVYTLDTLINDDFVKKLSLTEGDEEVEEALKALGIKQTEYEHYKDLYYTESRMMDQAVSKKLEYTKVMVFKAMLFDVRLKSADRDLYVDYLKVTPDNNINNVLVSAEQLRVVKMAKSNHWDILKDVPLLRAEICNSQW